jgi:aspartate/methionine/tyrosine aminotransferase
MSKSFGLSGLRIGWLASRDAKLLEKFQILKDYTTLCGSAPSEFLATLALKHKEVLLKNTMKIIGDNLQLLEKFFVEFSDLFSWVPPKAGSICFPKLLFKKPDFCDQVLKEAGILLLAGSLYQYSDEYFRIGFGKTKMPQVLTLFKKYLRKTF